jgi:predicted Fe-S protein YdhL (DUF1289 family)
VKLSNISWPELELPPINLLSFNTETSPCTKRCSLNGNICTGCGRTKDEITAWTLLDPIDKLKVLQRLK